MNPTFRTLLLIVLSLQVTCLANAKKSWIHITTEHFEVFSETSKKRTRAIVEELHDTHGIFQRLFPTLGNSKQLRLKVLIPSERTLKRDLAPLYNGKPKKVAGFYGESLEGPILVINASGTWEMLRHVVMHEYTHHLLHRPGVEIPLWMNEGIAEVFSTIERQRKGTVVVGKPQKYGLAILSQTRPIPLIDLFQVTHESPEYNSQKHSQGSFYAQSWALIHFLLFGENNLPDHSFDNILQHAINGGEFNATTIKELLGIELDQLKKELSNYYRKGKYTSYRYTLDDASEDLLFEEIPFTGKDLAYLKTVSKLSIRGIEAASSDIDAFKNTYPDSHERHSLEGYTALMKGKDKDAVELLNKAIELGSTSPHTHLHYAGARLRRTINSTTYREDSLNRTDTIELLTALFKARELGGPFSHNLYRCIGEVWLSSREQATEEHIAVLYEGLQSFPEDAQVAFYLARYYERESKFDEALSLHEHYYRKNLETTLRLSFELLANRVKNAQAKAR